MLDIEMLKKYNEEQRRWIEGVAKDGIKGYGYYHKKLLQSLEKETVMLRQIISRCPNFFHREYPRNYFRNFDILICYEPICGRKRYVINLPHLLPNRRDLLTNFKRSIVDALKCEIMEYYENNRPEIIERASVTFINYYAPSINRQLRHDNDNTEISSVLNALTGFFIPDDSNLCCDLHILSRDAESSYTKIIIEERGGENE